jgi:EAL domain-containing protein (putative c-di-GMP-specific phosphodiesterase class I)
VARATTPEAGEAVTAESLGWQLRSALPPLRLHSVSVYSNDADILWLSEGALGPDEHNVVVEAIETLKLEKNQAYHELGMEDGRIAIFLSIRAPRGDLVGTVMILADMKSLTEGTMERIVTPQVRTILQKIAVFLHKLNPNASATTQSVVLPISAAVTPLASAPAAAPAKNSPTRTESLAPRQVEAILTLELAVDPPPVEKPKAAAGSPTATAGKAAPAGKASAPATPAARSKAAASPANARSGAAPKSFPSAPAQPAAPAPAPLPEIEVLPFDPSISIPAARPSAAAAPLPDIEVLAFDANIEIPTARPAAAAPAPAAAPKATAPAATPVAAKAAKATAPAAAEPVELINDTGAVPKLEGFDETTSIEPAIVLPAVSVPREPLSAADTAADLTLHVQELIKLRSSGRTRRYEVLARSQRDVGINEVPAAFVAESAKGGEGAALDALVVERLLKWLGQNGEVIWDSEPASFSVNLSIGALEDESFPQRIAGWLKETAVPAEYIGFEITEFACVQCRPQVQRFVEACEKLGCFLVIDNFSFDSNVFEFLGSRALRHVKIEPKLTAAAMKDKLPQALVVAILQACKVLGVHCVAKRIESKSAIQWLTAVGCDFAQAFLLEKPTPLESLVSGKPIQALREAT